MPWIKDAARGRCAPPRLPAFSLRRPRLVGYSMKFAKRLAGLVCGPGFALRKNFSPIL
jgi:hypothetical protein